jgi:glycine cleavage system pyridoxal-binding protein P
MPLNKETMDEIDRWVYFVMHGIEGLKKIISDSKKSPDEELVDKVVEATNGEKITDENHVENKIKEAVEGLGKRNANKVMKALKEGKITLGNLDTSLERIQEMKQAQGNA